jgi:hypothetical protein
MEAILWQLDWSFFFDKIHECHDESFQVDIFVRFFVEKSCEKSFVSQSSVSGSLF